MNPTLDISQLRKTFDSPDGRSQVIVEIERFGLSKGDQVVLKGSSGSGKTTFLHLIAGILTADQGQIRVAGEDMHGMSEGRRDEYRAHHIGYIFQTFNLLQGYTALENVLTGMMFAGRPDKKKAADLLRRVGLDNRLDYLPRQLSVGQQQRVAVARSMANSPELILADEPTGNLDPHLTLDMIHLIQNLAREREATLLLVTHDKDVMECFDQVHDFHELNQALKDRERHA